MSAPPHVVLLRGPQGLLIGHIAVGNAVAGLVQARAEDPALSYTATVLGSGEPVHGGNGAGLVCAALDVGGQRLVRAVLQSARSVQDATAALREAASSARAGSAAVLVADAREAAVLTVGEGGAEVQPLAAEHAGVQGLPALGELIARLRQAEPDPEEGSTPAAGLAALLTPDEPPRLHVALGPPSCSVFIRHWPGMELVPEETAGPEGAPLARLAAAVAQTTATDPDLRRAARRRLDRAEQEALLEGEAAEQMAARMDADTDDRGAAVRRLVAQSHAAELVRQALEELAVPAPPGSKPGPRL
jgi:hypothetical protein